MQNIYFHSSVKIASHTYHFFPNHTLVHLYKGRLHLQNQCDEMLTVNGQQSAFIGRDSYSHLYAEPDGDAPCEMLFFSLSRNFLCELYHTLDKRFRQPKGKELSALHLLPYTPNVESFFQSFVPYLQCGQMLPNDLLRIKMIEAARGLLDTNSRYAINLFDFASRCEMNVLDLLSKQKEIGFAWNAFAN